jgi:hypothetical protein
MHQPKRYRRKITAYFANGDIYQKAKMIRVWLGRLDNIKKENMAFMTIREAAKLVNDFFSTVNGSPACPSDRLTTRSFPLLVFRVNRKLERCLRCPG